MSTEPRPRHPATPARPAALTGYLAGAPPLLAAIERAWYRWGRGVPVNWRHEHSVALLDVAAASGLTPHQRGRAGAWSVRSADHWSGRARTYTQLQCLALGHMTDSVEYRFPCTLPPPAEQAVLMAVYVGAESMGLQEAGTLAAILQRMREWAWLPRADRAQRVSRVNLALPGRPYTGPRNQPARPAHQLH